MMMYWNVVQLVPVDPDLRVSLIHWVKHQC